MFITLIMFSLSDKQLNRFIKYTLCLWIVGNIIFFSPSRTRTNSRIYFNNTKFFGNKFLKNVIDNFLNNQSVNCFVFEFIPSLCTFNSNNNNNTWHSSGGERTAWNPGGHRFGVRKGSNIVRGHNALPRRRHPQWILVSSAARGYRCHGDTNFTPQHT